MQDRLKFRIWDKENKEYTTDSRIFLSPNGTVRYIEDSYWYDNVSEYYDVEFCTSLKDNNSKLIYDNDLIMIGNELYRVAIDDFGCRTVILDNNPFKEVIEWSDIVKIYYFHNKVDEIEVVGNIRENKDLLENKDE